MSEQPQMVFLGGPPPQPNPEFIKAMEAFQGKITAYEVECRLGLQRWQAILCTCRPYYDHAGDQSAPQSGCRVHQQFLITAEGQVYY